MKNYWIKYLPRVIRKRLEGRHDLQVIIKNTGWLFVDKILRMTVGLFVSVWIARYLGPDQFGLWNFAIAFTALFNALAILGLDSIVVRELVKHPEIKNKILGTAYRLKLIGGIATFLIAIITISIVRSGDTLTLWLVAISAAGFIFQSINVVDFYFQSKVQSKYSVYASNSAFFLITLVKIFLLLSSAPLISFAWVGLGEIVLVATFLIIAYQRDNQSIRDWLYDRQVACYLLKDSWPLILSGLAIMVYMRIDQIMIGQMLGSKAVGLYSAAIRISEVWYFIPMAIVSSIFPSIIESKNNNESQYYQRLQKLFNLMVLIGLVIAVPMTFISDWLVSALYGDEYKYAGQVLTIHIWTSIFVFLGIASSRWFVIENLQKYSFYRTLVGAIVNILLNFILIPKYGISGAAWATLIAQATANFLFNGFGRSVRPVFYMQIKAINILNSISSKNR